MLITVAKYAPASGKPFIDEGVVPTVEVKRAVPEIVVPEDQTRMSPRRRRTSQS